MKKTKEELVKNIINNMSKEEITKEIDLIKDAITFYSKKEFLQSSPNLTDYHYEVYLKRIKSKEERLALLQTALKKIEKAQQISKKYGVSNNKAKTMINFFEI